MARGLSLLVSAITTLFVLSAASACGEQGTAIPAGTVTIAQEQHASWVRSFNPFHPPGSSRWPTRGGIYEPLLVHNTMTGQYVPWLAEAFAFEDGGNKLVFRIRGGVSWSDGRPFVPSDVKFTFDLMRKYPSLDIDGVWKRIEGVQVAGDDVVFTFRQPFVPGLYYIARQPIVPAHIWENVDDPVLFANPSPVATGPFTEVLSFETQMYELGRNPRYWQPGKPKVERLRFPAFSTNDQANLALAFGEVDWSGKFVPAIDRTFVERDPQNHRYWFPLVNGTVMLYLNTAIPPFDDAAVRKALSMAIDRQKLVDVGVYGYTRPADATALCDAYASWRSEEALEKGNWVGFDAGRAAAALDEAGFPLDGSGVRRDAEGVPLKLPIEVVAGWSDWVRASQVVAHQLRAIGIDASVVAQDFGPWFDRLQRGEFRAAIGWTIEGATPYDVYRALLAGETKRPVGEIAVSNWHRFAAPGVDPVFAELERAVDPIRQRELVATLQTAFIEHAPAVPLFFNPSWGAYSEKRVTGFPSAKNPYAKLTPNDQPDALLVLVELESR